MTKKKKKFDFRKIKRFLPYIITGIVTLFLVSVGSLDKQNASASLSLDAFADENYRVSVDQLSGLYLVATVSDAVGLASANDVASNYVVVTSLRDAGQTGSSKLEKPPITNIITSRGVIEYTVGQGETMESIAIKFGVSTDQIRWSNGKKTAEVSPGDVLYVPSKPGIVYTVKSGETAESIAEKYGSSAAEIIALNDLEVSGVTEGMRILINGGSLPETERPEYVAPVVQVVYSYSYSGYGSSRTNVQELGSIYGAGNGYYPGQCTWWAKNMRPDLPNDLGNAGAWADNARARGFRVDNIPAPGAIYVSRSGWYGHVGYVEAVNPDGSIVETEMNYGWAYRVIRATIPAGAAAGFEYIH